MNKVYRKSLAPFKRLMHTAYVITPTTGALEQEKQACYLTKTMLIENAPSNIENNKEESRELIKSIRNTIIETMFFQRDEGLKFPKRMRERTRTYKLAKYKAEISSKVLTNLLRVVWSSESARSPDVLETTFSYRPDIVAPWQRIGENFQVSGKHGHLISGRKLLAPFADSETIESTCDQEVVWDDIISPLFDIHAKDTVFEANKGFHPNSPFPCPQKLLALNYHYWKPKHHFGQGLFYSFAHAMNYALENGGKMGEDLAQPVPMQYVSFDGTSLFFVWYQLNTLNFDDNGKTVKNIAWKEELKLYDHVTDIVEKGAEASTDFNEYTGQRMSLVDFDRKKLAETIENEQKVKVGIYGYNEDAASRFIDFMLYS